MSIILIKKACRAAIIVIFAVAFVSADIDDRKPVSGRSKGKTSPAKAQKKPATIRPLFETLFRI